MNESFAPNPEDVRAGELLEWRRAPEYVRLVGQAAEMLSTAAVALRGMAVYIDDPESSAYALQYTRIEAENLMQQAKSLLEEAQSAQKKG